ncbi:hypothetical protein V1508DRAFT_52906 [Lipomyces doorenjongii]|uniref:uncharacterized protein n=1 Tax=Lipomyces doorenjongii TaxID=383834 RepID=UPI0034CD4CD6
MSIIPDGKYSKLLYLPTYVELGIVLAAYIIMKLKFFHYARLLMLLPISPVPVRSCKNRRLKITIFPFACLRPCFSSGSYIARINWMRFAMQHQQPQQGQQVPLSKIQSPRSHARRGPCDDPELRNTRGVMALLDSTILRAGRRVNNKICLCRLL